MKNSTASRGKLKSGIAIIILGIVFILASFKAGYKAGYSQGSADVVQNVNSLSPVPIAPKIGN